MGILHPELTSEIAKWRAKHLKEIENKRQLAAERRKEIKERQRSEMPSTGRDWRFSANAVETIEIPQWAMEAVAERSASKAENEGGPDLMIAPGCFGLAMTFRIDAKECLQCPFQERCKPLAAQALITLSTERENDSEFHKEFAERRAHDLARNRKDKAKSRAKAKVIASPKRHPIAFVALTREALADRKAKLVEWLAHDAPRQRQHRKHQKEILLDYVVFQNERGRLSGDPGPTAFAHALSQQTGKTIIISSAQKRLARLCRLESAEGPWFDPERILLA